jgi:outer membrane protein
MNKKPAIALIAAALALALAQPAAAFEQGDWLLRLGIHNVNPKSDNGSLAGGALDAEVGSSTRPTFMAEYFFTPNWGVEILASLPYEHDVDLNGAKAASLKHLPPTVSLQYHFDTESNFKPYFGAGVNFTWIFSEDTTGPLAGTDLELDNSWGFAAHLGFDYALSNGWYWGADLRWMDIETDASVDGTDVGTVDVDPLAYGIYLGWTF